MTATKTDARLILLAALVGILSAAAGYSLWKLRYEGPAGMTAALRILPEPRSVAEFSLIDQEGQPFSLDRLRGKWSLLFFGFTHCPDVCPSAMYDLKRVHQAMLESDPHDTEHQVIFVSVDPERDSPDRLKAYASYFNPDFMGVTGTHEQLAPLTRQLGVAYRIEPHEEGSPSYSVDHSAGVMLTDPHGRLHGVFTAPLDADKMVHDLGLVME